MNIPVFFGLISAELIESPTTFDNVINGVPNTFEWLVNREIVFTLLRHTNDAIRALLNVLIFTKRHLTKKDHTMQAIRSALSSQTLYVNIQNQSKLF